MFRLRTIGTVLLVIVIALITVNSLNNSYFAKVASGKTPYNAQSTELRINLWLLKARADLGQTHAKYDYAILMFQHSKNPAAVKKAYKEIQSLAKQGNSSALYLMGLVNITGAKGIKVNDEKGMSYIQEAAKKGSKPAQQFLAKFKALDKSAN